MVFETTPLKIHGYPHIGVCVKSDSRLRRRLLIRGLHRDEFDCNTKLEARAGKRLGHLKMTFKSTERPLAVDILGLFSCGFLQWYMEQLLA